MYYASGKHNGIIWDVMANKPLLKFRDGVAMIKDDKIIDKVKSMGYSVFGDEKKEKSKKK